MSKLSKAQVSQMSPVKMANDQTNLLPLKDSLDHKFRKFIGMLTITYCEHCDSSIDALHCHSVVKLFSSSPYPISYCLLHHFVYTPANYWSVSDLKYVSF